MVMAALNSATLRRAATVVRDRRRGAGYGHTDARVVDRADGRFATAARPLDAHFALLHPGVLRLLRRLVGGLLRGERRAFARTAEAARARRRLRDQVAFQV